MLPGRVDPYAKSLENRGIRATYELHDRLLSNRRSRGLFADETPALDDVQRRIVADVESRGFALATFADLFPEQERWAELETMRDRFVSETESDLAKGGDHVRVRAGKEFVVRLHSYGVALGLDDPWFAACASRRMLDIANTYLQMWSKLEYLDVWYSVPQPKEANRVSSQLWHRDYNDKHLLKAFLYLVDVDEEMGPFQYIAGSQPGGPYADAWPWQPLGTELPVRRGARAADSGVGHPDLRRCEGVRRVLQHVRLSSRRVLDDRAPHSRDRDVLVARIARFADRAELRLLGLARRARCSHAVRRQLIPAPASGSVGIMTRRERLGRNEVTEVGVDLRADPQFVSDPSARSEVGQSSAVVLSLRVVQQHDPAVLQQRRSLGEAAPPLSSVDDDHVEAKSKSRRHPNVVVQRLAAIDEPGRAGVAGVDRSFVEDDHPHAPSACAAPGCT